MSTVDKWGQAISIPTLSDEPNIESLVATINALASPGIMTFANATARAASIPTPTHGMLTNLVAEDRIDRWDGTRWFPITPGPWHATSFYSAHAAHSGSPGYRYVNGTVELRGKTQRASGGQYYHGSAEGWNFAEMPTNWRPTTYQHFTQPCELGSSIYSVRIQIATDGVMTIHTPPGSTSTTEGLRWVSMDGISYPLDTPPATL